QGGEQGLGRVRLGDGDADEGGEARAGGGAQSGGRAVAGVGPAVEAGAALDGFGGAGRGGQLLGHPRGEPPGAPQGGQGCRDEELQGPPEPAGGDQVEEAAPSVLGRGGGVGERGEVPDEMGAGAEELEGERGVALLGELVVEEDVRGAEEDGVAVAGGGRDAQQGGEALAGVALVGRDVGGGVAEAADVGAARAAGGGQGAVGGERGVEAGCRGGGDAGREAFHGGAAGGDQHGPAAGVGGGVVQPGLLGRGQQVGDGDQERGVGTGRG